MQDAYTLLLLGNLISGNILCRCKKISNRINLLYALGSFHIGFILIQFHRKLQRVPLVNILSHYTEYCFVVYWLVHCSVNDMDFIFLAYQKIGFPA